MIALLSLVEAIRFRLHDFGGDRGDPSAGYYARWQEDDSPCLWKNREIVHYIRLGLQDIAGRSPWREEGATADVLGDDTRIAVMAGSPEVETGPYSDQVEHVRLVSSGRLLEKTETGRMDAAFAGTWTTQVGTPTHYLEPRRGLIRLYPIPVIDDEIRLRVHRRAWDEFAWEDVQSERQPSLLLCDVPDALEAAIIEAACREAYLKRDADTYSAQSSQLCEARLTAMVGPPISWRHREARRHNANLPVAIRGHSYHRAGSRWHRVEEMD
jgi:hypothetical protein